MPSIKIPKKSTDTDMTPFVDIAFLILSFFIMATKFKPEEPVKVETPNSVSSDILKENNALLITIDEDSKVYINISAVKEPDEKLGAVINGIAASRGLALTDAEKANFKRAPIIGVPFASLKGYLDVPNADQGKMKQPGIPVLDSLNNELVWWIAETKKVFAGDKLLYLIKGDNKSKYPTFEAVINALRRNEEFKYNLITSQEGAPAGTELFIERLKQQTK
ncbi:MAG: biopolymer transporter ExbD [Citrobacter freundii]|nr:MAG: biopolymer transporter ExbD [Citrobacter freundii]